MNPHRDLRGTRFHVVGPYDDDLVDVHVGNTGVPLVVRRLTHDERIELIAMLLATVPHGPDLPQNISDTQRRIVDAAEEASQLAQWRADADRDRAGLDPSRDGQ